MKILIVTDAWHPQVCGVVTTIENTIENLEKMGHETFLITHKDFRSFSCPGQKDIRLALDIWKLSRKIRDIDPEAIHIMTEGPLGFAARHWCIHSSIPFTTVYASRFPEYLEMRIKIPARCTYPFYRRFHAKASGVMVSTHSLLKEMRERKFNQNLLIWGRGVNSRLFSPGMGNLSFGPRPHFLYVGRIAPEKNITTFLDLELPGTKIVVGDGPWLGKLRNTYPQTVFTGYRFGEQLARIYSSSDVFIFPSLTDTYGLVMLEAMASGLPVAAFPVTGPKDVVIHGETGFLDNNLKRAALKAMYLDRKKCRDFAIKKNWTKSTGEFLENLVRVKTSMR